MTITWYPLHFWDRGWHLLMIMRQNTRKASNVVDLWTNYVHNSFYAKIFGSIQDHTLQIVKTSFMHDVLSPNYVQKYRCKHKFQLQKYFLSQVYLKID